MPGIPPDGEPVPADGSLPPAARSGLGERPFGIYVHVPFCRTRCGYCDFNTYTAAELGGASPGGYVAAAVQEIVLARKALGDEELPVSTVFFGGGTPTLLSPARLGEILGAIDAEFGLAQGAEVTVEANPESVDLPALGDLRARGITRCSFGMQSSQSHVLAVLDRAHEPGRPASCARWAREAGFDHVSLDLIYGTPGESDDDWRRSLDAAIGAGPDHVSAYALVVEDGTRLAARVRRGEVDPPEDDVLADRYLMADDRLAEAGYRWYEISNWAAGPGARCEHNMLYWTGADWWGVGPGAHSHVGGTRWWNVRHPSAYAARLTAGRSPGHGREILSPDSRAFEGIMLATRLASGCPVTAVPAEGREYARQAVATRLIEPGAFAGGMIVLTRQGRLVADAVVRGLTG